MLILKYQPRWRDDFKRIKEILQTPMATVDICIEHIGSTSVEGLAAKPIIDIDMFYPKQETFEEVKLILQATGYDHHGDQGIRGREVFKRSPNGEEHAVLDSIRHHLYVCHADCAELQRHLLFRDYLRSHPAARKDYEDLKYRIARAANQDRKKYANLKETMARNFIESIIEQAANTDGFDGPD